MSSLIYQIGLSLMSILAFIKRRGYSPSVMPIYYLMLIAFLVESIGYFCLKLYDSLVPWVYTLYRPLSVYFHLLYFSKLPDYNCPLKPNSLLILFCAICLFLIGIWVNTYDIKTNLSFILESLLLIVLSLHFLFKLLDKPEIQIFKYPHFFIITAILFFRTNSFLIMGLVNYIKTKNVPLASAVFSIQHYILLIYYGMILFGLYLDAKQGKNAKKE